MTENIKRINNQLTIIAIFAALAEVNATIAIGLIDKELHYVFIWFVIGFPTLLVVLFFITLNFNTTVIYSPSDYREDKTFVDSIYGLGTKKVKDNSLTNEVLSKTLENLEQKLINSIDAKINEQGTKTISNVQINEILAKYKEEIKELSEKAIEESRHIDLGLPIELKSEIVNWIAFPAFVPIIYAIVKENANSIEQLKDYEHKYHFPARWDKTGVNALIKKDILKGTTSEFRIEQKIKVPLENWISANEQIILQIIESFGRPSEKGKFTEEARVIAQKLSF